VRTEADAGNPEDRDELKYLEEYKSARAHGGKLKGVVPGIRMMGEWLLPMVIVGYKGVKGMNATKGGCWGATKRIVGAWEPYSEHGGKEG